MNLSMIKNYLAVIMLVISGYFVHGQRHEIGFKVGSSNLVGDIGNRNFIQFPTGDIAKNPFHIGISYKRNINPYQGIKFSLGYNSVYFNDKDAKEIYRQNRNISNSNDSFESSLVFEYNFFPINNSTRSSMMSPYIFGGATALLHETEATEITVSPKAPSLGAGYAITHKEVGNGKKKFAGGLVFGLGLKYKFNHSWAISGEVAFRPTFTDGLDYNNMEEHTITTIYKNIRAEELALVNGAVNDYIKNNSVGNLNSKDWLNSITIGISYAFGRPPCYCD